MAAPNIARVATEDVNGVVAKKIAMFAGATKTVVAQQQVVRAAEQASRGRPAQKNGEEAADQYLRALAAQFEQNCQSAGGEGTVAVAVESLLAAASSLRDVAVLRRQLREAVEAAAEQSKPSAWAQREAKYRSDLEHYEATITKLRMEAVEMDAEMSMLREGLSVRPLEQRIRELEDQLRLQHKESETLRAQLHELQLKHRNLLETSPQINAMWQDVLQQQKSTLLPSTVTTFPAVHPANMHLPKQPSLEASNSVCSNGWRDDLGVVADDSLINPLFEHTSGLLRSPESGSHTGGQPGYMLSSPRSTGDSLPSAVPMQHMLPRLGDTSPGPNGIGAFSPGQGYPSRSSSPRPTMDQIGPSYTDSSPGSALIHDMLRSDLSSRPETPGSDYASTETVGASRLNSTTPLTPPPASAGSSSLSFDFATATSLKRDSTGTEPYLVGNDGITYRRRSGDEGHRVLEIHPDHPGHPAPGGQNPNGQQRQHQQRRADPSDHPMYDRVDSSGRRVTDGQDEDGRRHACTPTRSSLDDAQIRVVGTRGSPAGSSSSADAYALVGDQQLVSAADLARQMQEKQPGNALSVATEMALRAQAELVVRAQAYDAMMARLQTALEESDIEKAALEAEKFELEMRLASFEQQQRSAPSSVGSMAERKGSWWFARRPSLPVPLDKEQHSFTANMSHLSKSAGASPMLSPSISLQPRSIRDRTSSSEDHEASATSGSQSLLHTVMERFKGTRVHTAMEALLEECDSLRDTRSTLHEETRVIMNKLVGAQVQVAEAQATNLQLRRTLLRALEREAEWETRLRELQYMLDLATQPAPSPTSSQMTPRSCSEPTPSVHRTRSGGSEAEQANPKRRPWELRLPAIDGERLDDVELDSPSARSAASDVRSGSPGVSHAPSGDLGSPLATVSDDALHVVKLDGGVVSVRTPTA